MMSSHESVNSFFLERKMSRKHDYKKLNSKEYSYINRYMDNIHKTAIFYDTTFVNKKLHFTLKVHLLQ